MPRVSIIVVNWNTRDRLAECLDSILHTAEGPDCETIVIDNASTDGSPAMVREHFPRVHVIENSENVGFARANNQAMKLGRGRYLLLLNSDALVTPGAIQSLVNLADAVPQAGIVGARLLNLDGSFQASHTSFPTLWREFLVLSGLGRLLHGRWYPSHGPEVEKGPQPVDYVEGACLLVRREAYQAVGGLDETFFMYAEEVDWCYAMWKNGWQVWYQPEAQVIHWGGGSSRTRHLEREGDLYRSRIHYFRKHYGEVSAVLLKLQIYGFTLLKIAVHGLLRWVSRGRYGRPVVSLRRLTAELNEA